jgi:hypothetical protein
LTYFNPSKFRDFEHETLNKGLRSDVFMGKTAEFIIYLNIIACILLKRKAKKFSMHAGIEDWFAIFARDSYRCCQYSSS